MGDKAHCSPASLSFAQPVANDSVDPMVGGAEPTQLHPLAILNLLGIRVSPLDGDVRVGVGVDEDVEGAVAVELGEEGDRGGDLAEDGGDLGLDLGLGLVRVLLRCPRRGT